MAIRVAAGGRYKIFKIYSSLKHTLRVSIFYCYTKILQVPVLTKRWTVIAAVKKIAIINRNIRSSVSTQAYLKKSKQVIIIGAGRLVFV